MACDPRSRAMRTALFALVIIVLLIPCSLRAELPALPGSSRTVTKLSEILAWAPKDIVPKKGVGWTKPQMEAASDAINKKLAEQPTILKMRVEVADVFPQDDDLVVFSSLPNNEGYRIRLFAHFPKDWKDRLVKIKKGDKVSIEAPVYYLKYQMQWNEFALVIGTQKGTIEK
jgi:hypothetical protein